MKKIYLSTVLILWHSLLWAQVTTHIRSSKETWPLDKYNVRDAAPAALTLAAVDTAALLKADALEARQNVPPRFGKAVAVSADLTSAGSWSPAVGGRLWQFTLTAPRAYSLNFFFDKFYLPPGAELYLYNAARSMVMGPITNAQNTPTGVYATDILNGHEVTIALFEPAAVSGKSQLHLARAVHGYRKVRGANQEYSDPQYGLSAACEVDINCSAGNAWQNESYSVARVLIDQATRLCSGSLLNDACQSFTPNFLTAFHCVDLNEDGTIASSEANDVQSWVFRFNYKTAACGAGEGAYYTTFSGAQLLAGYNPSDFALLRLSQSPLTNNNDGLNGHITYAGWSRSNTPATSTAAIHHPRGDVMKIATSNTAAVAEQWMNNGPTHWYTNFNVGTIEPGSSGSPLFDQNHHVIGQNHGDQLNKTGDFCANHQGDYGRFDVSWEGGGTPQTRLKDWLTTDPNVIQVNTAQPTITGPSDVCYQSATFQVLSTNVTWSASPISLFTNSSGTGSSFSTAEANGMQGTGTITATFNSCGPGTGPTVSVSRTVRVGTEPTGRYSAATSSGTLGTVQFVSSGRVDIYLDQNYDFTFTSSSSTIPVTKNSYTSAYFYLSSGQGVQITASAAGSTCGLVGHFSFAPKSSPYAYQAAPNPATDEFTVTAVEPTAQKTSETNYSAAASPNATFPAFDADLYDYFGRIVKTQRSDHGKSVLNVRDLPAGLYSLRVGTGKEAFIQHIQVSH